MTINCLVFKTKLSKSSITKYCCFETIIKIANKIKKYCNIIFATFKTTQICHFHKNFSFIIYLNILKYINIRVYLFKENYWQRNIMNILMWNILNFYISFDFLNHLFYSLISLVWFLSFFCFVLLTLQCLVST